MGAIMRRREGEETWHRLLEWDRGQASSERLAAVILSNDSFHNVDPSHPLGGKDGLKDMVLSYQGQKWIGAVYFPRGQQNFPTIKKKIIHDIEDVKKNYAHGLAFVTNQELRLSERTELSEISPEVDVQIYHLERISTLLNTPPFYGIRMEFLDIEMSKEEQLFFFATQAQKISILQTELEKLTIGLENFKSFHQLSQAKKLVENDEDFNGEDNLGPYSDFEWGMINGKLSALRWVLGEDWDMLDT